MKISTALAAIGATLFMTACGNELDSPAWPMGRNSCNIGGSKPDELHSQYKHGIQHITWKRAYWDCDPPGIDKHGGGYRPAI